MFYSTTIFILLACSFAIVTALPADEEHVVGGVRTLRGDDMKDAENELKKSLEKLAAGDGPYYKLSKVIWASSQIVSGKLIRMNVDLIDTNADTKNCNVSVWSQYWLENGIEVTFECPGEEKVVKKHSAEMSA